MARIDTVAEKFTWSAGGQHRGAGKDHAQAMCIAGMIAINRDHADASAMTGEQLHRFAFSAKADA